MGIQVYRCTGVQVYRCVLVPGACLRERERLDPSPLSPSSTCLHHCRGDSRGRCHGLALADTYNLKGGGRGGER